VSFWGNSDHFFHQTWMRNNTSSAQSMSSSISFNYQTSATITVTAKFSEFFTASAAVTYAKSVTHTDTFNLNVPANKKGQITTYNHSDYYTGTYNNSSFWILATYK
jgi:hypothetical protein